MIVCHQCGGPTVGHQSAQESPQVLDAKSIRQPASVQKLREPRVARFFIASGERHVLTPSGTTRQCSRRADGKYIGDP